MNIDNAISNKELLEACYGADTAAITLFYERFRDLVYSAIHGWMNKYAHGEDREEGVDEVFQQTFLELMDNGFAKLKQAHDQNKPAALIFLIAYQCAGRHFKKKWKTEKRRIELGDPEPAGGEGIIGGLDREAINKLIGEFLDTLNPKEQKVFELRFGGGLEYEIIAGRTGLTTNNVGVMISRMKEKFKAFIKEECPDILNLL